MPPPPPSQDTQDPHKSDPDTLAMPPPPDPKPLNQDVILEPELNALNTCLKNAIVRTGQIYSFYADRTRLKHTLQPPVSQLASLGREIERYDQLCDSIESHLLRAIAVLKRDLRREEQRKRDLALAASRGKVSEPPTVSETVAAQISAPLQDDSSAPIVQSSSHATVSLPPSRRPSAISISSLHRPIIPPKLDLSSTSFRMPEDPSLFSGGLASPVTLAPKSARPMGANEFPPELMAAFASAANDSGGSVDVDLTMQDAGDQLPMSLDTAAGSSVDKPIELDLDSMEIDMSDLFGDSSEHENPTSTKTPVDGIFSPTGSQIDNDVRQIDHDEKGQREEGTFLATFSRTANEIFSHTAKVPSAGTQNMSSPGAILADFSNPNQPRNDSDSSRSAEASNMSSGSTAFDIGSLDLSNLSPGFFSNPHDSDVTFMMDDLLNMGGNAGDAKGNSTTNAS
ncbi:hypothetical protein AX17_000859 [Amanita inopinata Kibby_2008]|nr:hypothetical protein AX17_000859 [Amanita inopinata Kibby_2008]